MGSCAHISAKLQLLMREGNPGNADTVLLRGISCQTSPSAADVEQMHSRLQPQFLADEVELHFLGFVEARGMIPARACIHHAAVEHVLIELIARS